MNKGYFDNAATTLVKPEGMYQFVADYMMNNGTNVGRSNVATTKSAGALVKETRNLLLDLVQAPKTKEVVFLPSATIALNTILNGITFKEKDTIYLSHFEHNAVIRTLAKLQKEIDIQIKFLEMNKETLTYDIFAIEKQFAQNPPSLVVLSHVSNVTGIVAPIERISGLAKVYNSIVVVDGSQACGVVNERVDNKIDYYVFAGHKTLMSPFGVAGFICDKNTTLPPFIYGGTGIDSANIEMPNYVPERFEAGSQNIMAIAGLNYSLKWIKENKEYIQSKEKENLEILRKLLNKYRFIKIIEGCGDKVSIIACSFDGLTSNEAGRVLAEKGVVVRTGLHCAPLAHKFLNSFPEGLVRFSITCFTDREDFKVLEDALDYIEEEL